MITFESRQKVIRNADLITRKAHSLYPHVSESRIVSMIGEDKVKDLFWGNMSLRYALKFAAQRYNMVIVFYFIFIKNFSMVYMICSIRINFKIRADFFII